MSNKVEDLELCWHFLYVLKDDLDNDDEKFMARVARVLSDAKDNEEKLKAEVVQLKEEIKSLKPNNSPGGGPR